MNHHRHTSFCYLLFFLISFGYVFAGANTASDYTPYISPDKHLDPAWVASLKERGSQRVYKGDELRLISMPVGGIGAGQLEVTGTGELGTWWIFNVSPEANRGRGYTTGAGYIDPLEIEKPVSSGFVIGIKQEDGKKEVLRLDGSGFDDIEFIGEYPVASFHFKDHQKQLPVTIRSKVYSPFVPLSVRDSANPVTILSYTVENTSSDSVEIDLGGWLENAVTTESEGKRKNQVFKSENLSGVQLGIQLAKNSPEAKREEAVLFEEFENDTFAGRWSVEGNAFSDAPVKVFDANFMEPVRHYVGLGFACSRQYFWPSARATGKLQSKVFRIEHERIRFKIAGGHFENEACMNLVIDGEVVCSATGNDSNDFEEVQWDVSPYIGKNAQLVILDTKADGGSLDHIMIDDIYFVNPGIKSPAMPRGTGEATYGDLAISVLDGNATTSVGWKQHSDFLKAFEGSNASGSDDRTYDLDESGIGSVSTSFTLAPDEKQTVTFLVSWYFPNLYNPEAGGCVGHIYNNWYESSVDVAEWVADQFERLQQETELFRATYHDTTLPYWLANRISMPLSTLACDNVKIHENGRMYCFEGVSFCNGTCGHVYNFVAAIAKLFPELERSVRIQQDFNETYGFDPLTGRINFRGHSGADPVARNNFATDAQSGYVLKAYREHLNSTNHTFLKQVWPNVKLAMNYQVFRDGAERGLEPNGVLEGKQTFWDPMWWGPNPYNNTLYLGALRAAEEMARIMGEDPLADRYRGIFENGSQWMQTHMWNGEYYVSMYPEGKWSTWWNGVAQLHEEQNNAAHYVRAFGERDEHYYTATACDAQQLFGQNWAHQLGLGYILPPEHCRIASKSIFKYNWTPDISNVYDLYPPKHRVLAAPGEAVLVNGAWPKMERQSFENTHDKDDAWTGLEYESACDMITEGNLDEALIVIRSVHDRYEAIKRNPWCEVEGADHYSRAMHAWNVLLSLSGFSYDGPAGNIGFCPRITADNFKSFFSTAEGWGTFEQIRNDGGIQQDNIMLKYGELKLNELSLDVVVEVKRVSVMFDGQRLKSTFVQDGSQLRIRLNESISIKAKQALKIEIR